MVFEILIKICGNNVINMNTELLDSGILGSFDFIKLLSEFEKNGIEIQPTQVSKECFRTPENIIKLALEKNKITN